MRYRVTHTTEYHYGELVPLCHNVIRLHPRDTARQRCLRFELTVSPTPAERRERVDFYGNHATWVSLQEAHEVLRIEAVSEVRVQPALSPTPSAGPAWDRVPAMLEGSRDPALIAAREYTFNSHYITADPALAAYARPSFEPGRSLLDGVLDLTGRIYREFIFDSRATTVGTPVLDVLRNRRGVCQDFAHVQIGCLRSIGLAARYVSGYVLTRPPPGRRRLVGADASHAWIAAFVPDVGWIDFDPTNGVIPSDQHITLGWARDYDDVSLVKGVIIGGHRQRMRYGVDVEPLDSAA